jgi:archaellum component FlaC
MTKEEEDALAELLRKQQHVNEGVRELLNILEMLRHDLHNILTVVKGEADLAVERVRKKMNDFYTNFPEFHE